MRSVSVRAYSGGVLALVVLAALVTAACRPAPASTPSSSGSFDPMTMTECEIEATRIAKEQETLKAKFESRETEPADPRWYEAELADVRTGETFALSDFQGQVLLVETTAVWCALCLQQQMHERSLLEKGVEGAVFVTLDIDPNESAEVLAEHAEKHHFEWRFAVAPKKVARALSEQFGPNVLHPPAVPIILMDVQDGARLLPLGVKPADILAEEIAASRGG